MLNLFFICMLLLIGYYWSISMKAREVAFKAAVAHCHKMDVMLLDDYVALNGQWLKRDGQGKVKVWRSFLFEFSSTGDERYHGKVVMLGGMVLSVQLEAHRIQEE